MKRNIVIPEFILHGIKPNHKSIADDVLVFGGDTETVNGEPHTLQMTHRGETKFWYVNRKNILSTFLGYLDYELRRGGWGVVYCHYLFFDLPVLFRDEDPRLWQASNFKLKREGWTCFINSEKRFFAKLNKGYHKTVYIVDSFAYFPTSLDNIGKMLCPDLPKLKKPAGLGQIALKTPEFEEYAKRDSVIEERFGKFILDAHKKYDVRISVSLPQMASFIFRHKFLKKDDCISYPPIEVSRAAIRSYHGGKNGIYVPPGVYENCSEIDLNSAYSYAMKCLPSFLKGRYAYTSVFHPDKCGVYNISGEVHCPYNIFFDDVFKPVQGKFRDIWVTGYELEEALKYKEVKIDHLFGYIWEPDSDRNPLGEYVDHFYELKNNTPRSDPMYKFYKDAMNCLYGKFIQAVEIRELEALENSGKVSFDFKIEENRKGELKVIQGKKKFKAGGMFHPFIASMITGKVRAMIHDLEHKFKALHTATDSVKTLLPVSGETDVLGGYKLEVKGLCVLLRNKVYLHFNENNELKKYALHGFQGKVGELLQCVVERRNEYKVNHIFKVREALRRRKEALTMLEDDRVFKFDWSKFDGKGFSYTKKEEFDEDGTLQKTRYFGKIN